MKHNHFDRMDGQTNRENGTLMGGTLLRNVQRGAPRSEVATMIKCVFGCNQMIYESLMSEHRCHKRLENEERLAKALKP